MARPMGVRAMPSQVPGAASGVAAQMSRYGVGAGPQAAGLPPGAAPNIQEALQNMRHQLSFPPGQAPQGATGALGPNTMGGGLNPQAQGPGAPGNGLPPRLQALAAQNPQAAQARFSQFKAGQLPGQQGMQPQGKPPVQATPFPAPQGGRGGTPPIYAGGQGQLGGRPSQEGPIAYTGPNGSGTMQPSTGSARPWESQVQADPRQMGDFLKNMGRDPQTGGVAQMPSQPAMQEAPGQAPAGLPTKPNFGGQADGGYQSPPWVGSMGGGGIDPREQLRQRLGQMMHY